MDNAKAGLRDALLAPQPAERIGAATDAIHSQLLRESRHLGSSNFAAIHPRDLRILYQAYDEHFFAGSIAAAVGATPLNFRLSRRMTSVGGKTVRTRRRLAGGGIQTDYEIVLSTTLLFQTFHDVTRTVRVSGLVCRDRLQALQRIFEHELIHLCEMLVWDDSSCTQPRFRTIANGLFSHREHTHQLITPRERAHSKFGIQVGDRVSFPFEGRPLHGIVNRITKRATVLVESERGGRYSDGRRYAKYYVPLTHLKKADPASHRVD